ncbi:distal tail protein Dit [Metabacillus sp. 22489]|uniref:distal tail protein Dit n=1 Tax=Metabacillus sp. 22489 TaxID=3453928 RepID=UPI003F865E4B
MGMTFNNERRSYLTILKGRERPSWAPIEQELIEIPGRAGAYKKSKKVKVRQINVPVLIEAENIADIQKVKEDLASWLITDEAAPLVFDDEPNRIYYAEVDGSLDLEEFVNIGTGVISFICADPYKYGPLHRGVFESEIASITNSGTTETYPIFRATVKEPITLLDIVTEDAYMSIGESVDLESEVAFKKEERLLWQEMSTMVGWSEATAVDGGVIAGSMVTDGYKFIASSYGNGSAWHGPAKRITIPNGPLTDFRVDALVELGNRQAIKAGRVEIYLLDSSNAVVAKMALKDTHKGIALAYGEARLGGSTSKQFLINEYGDKKGSWNDFYGMLRIQRIGKKWTAYIAKIDTDTNLHHTRRTVSYLDVKGTYNKTVSQIAVHVAQYGSYSPATLGIYDLKVFRINSHSDEQIPYIADAGDVIEINHAKNSILINGEDRKDLKDFGASFFSLKSGTNTVQISPYSSLENVEVEWRPRYL